MIFSVNEALTYAIYNVVGNKDVVNPYSMPDGYNGNSWDLVFLKNQ